MSKIYQFEELTIWKESVQLEVEIIQLLRQEKMKTEFEIRNQLTRSGLSISNNIAEGFEYNNDKQFRKYLYYAKGSAGETRNIFWILKRTGLVDDGICMNFIERLTIISKQIKSLIDYLDKPDRNAARII